MRITLRKLSGVEWNPRYSSSNSPCSALRKLSGVELNPRYSSSNSPCSALRKLGGVELNPRYSSSISPCSAFLFGPFNCFSQRRWKKPVDSARTRLESRTRDLKLDRLQIYLRKLRLVFNLFDLISKQKDSYASVQRMSTWTKIVGLNIAIGKFIHKYPHIFHVFIHPIRKNLCCCITRELLDLIEEEERTVNELELEAVQRIKKLLMLSLKGSLHVHALRLVRKELGLPENFRESILQKYATEFKLVDLERVDIVGRDEELGVEEVEKWREKQYREKWLSEHETKYAFPIDFPTGYKKESGFRVKMNNWVRLPFIKPYENKDITMIRNCRSVERFEKRIVGVLHEFLSLTVEKKVDVERLVHFRKDFGMVVNLRELLLKHPGIFYISTKGGSQTVFLREAYSKDSLFVPNPIYVVRRKMLDLILLGRWNPRDVRNEEKINEENGVEISSSGDCSCNGDGDWIIPILDRVNSERNDSD